MEQKDFNTGKRKYTHLNESERYKIEVYSEDKKSIAEIAQKLGRDRSTIYREIKRSSIMRIQYDLNEKCQYRADVAQRKSRERSKNKGRNLKIGHDHDLEQYIRKMILNKRYSPDVVIGSIKETGLKFKNMICTKTLYSYINKGIFSGISNENLWEKRKRKKKSYRKIYRVSRNNRLARYIHQRPAIIDSREEYGHWEGDCVKSSKTNKSGALTLTERKSRQKIIIKLKRISQKEIKKAINRLERKYGHLFKVIFKSITFDNGVEFLDWQSLEISVLNPKQTRTVIYFAHAFAAWERGSNEVNNKMFRRFVPKGTNIYDIPLHEIKKIENWMNNYPRKILGYKSANQITNECLQINSNKGA